MATLQQKNQHLLWRAGFGISSADIQKISTVASKEIFSSLLKSSQNKPAVIDVASDLLEDYAMEVRERLKGNKKDGRLDELQKAEKKDLRKENRERLKDLNLKWLNEMAGSDAQLREKMSLFWHGHFACRNQNSYFQQLLLQEIRTNALGSFKELLTSLSKSAAMLAFLNNQQNKKQHPNENFAREVMELFTLGRGNYSERDIKEAARAFTGWGYDVKGEFAFRRFQHDDGSKTVLGKTGNLTGEEVLDILLERKETATFICKKIYKYFVNDTVDPVNLKWLSDRFYQSNYNIKGLMTDIFTSDWFYSDKNIGTKIKSPVELLVGLRRTVPMKLNNEDVQLLMQRALGQVLFYPPNVAGWPGGRNWIDSSTLMFRLRIPQLIKDNEVVNIHAKTDDDVSMGMMDTGKANKKMLVEMQGQNRFRINADVNWEAYIKQFENVGREKLYDRIEKIILQSATGSVDMAVVEKSADSSNRENYIKTITVALMSTPEYQMC
jgi:uncharacterized protein (DUF1800 family)